MNDTITQMRLSMRLDVYRRIYAEKNTSKDNLDRRKWETVLQVAEAARKNSTLTPEVVDDVRLALNKL